jgi:hypothetical protein
MPQALLGKGPRDQPPAILNLGINPLLQEHFLVFSKLLAVIQALIFVFIDAVAG